MALFKRDKNRRADKEVAVDPPVTDAEPVESEPIESEPVPQVNISMSTFGAPAAPPTPIAAPAITRPAAPPRRNADGPSAGRSTRKNRDGVGASR